MEKISLRLSNSMTKIRSRCLLNVTVNFCYSRMQMCYVCMFNSILPWTAAMNIHQTYKTIRSIIFHPVNFVTCLSPRPNCGMQMDVYHRLHVCPL